MKQSTLSIAVLALISQTGAINLDKQVSADDFDGMGESTPVHTVAQVSTSYDETLQEQNEKDDVVAKEKAVIDQQKKKDAQEAEYKRKYNQFDGLIHEEDGTLKDQGDKKVVAGVNKFNQQSLMQEEPDAWTLKKKRDADEKEEKSFMNEFDGTYHNKDGTRTFPEATGGGIVGGVNKFTQVKSVHKKHHKHHKKNKKRDDKEDDTAEADTKGKVVAAVKQEAETNEKVRNAEEAAAAKKAKDEAEFKEKFSTIDGLLHNKDGSKQDLEGKIINGVNKLAQHKRVHSHHNKNKHHVHAHAKQHHNSTKKAGAEKEELTQEFEKKDHNAKGLAQWLESEEPESDNAVQHKHKGHHQHAAKHHKKIHHQHEKHGAHSLHQADQEQHKKHEKKHHAKKHEGHVHKVKKAHHHKKEPVAIQMNSTKIAEVQVNATSNVTSVSNVSKNVSANVTLSANLTKNSTTNVTQNATAAIKQAVKK